MLHKTRGIVLHKVAYSDRYWIVHIYTESFGISSYTVSAGGSRRSKVSRSLFMPLSILEMEVDHIAGRDIQRIREVGTSCALPSIQSHPVKNVIALFLSEILYRTLRTNESDGRLFTYIYESICYLESLEDSISNFHIVFLINLSHYLGIYPNIDSYIKGSYFDLAGGVFVESVPMHRYYLDRRDGVIMLRLLRMTYVNMSLYTFSRSERVLILSRLLDYYRLHLSGFPEIRSLSVLQSLFT